MNDRLRQLAEQAGLNVDPQSLKVEKFAELVLTDVMDILATYRLRAIFEDGFEHNCEHPINAIRKHFGVEG